MRAITRGKTITITIPMPSMLFMTPPRSVHESDLAIALVVLAPRTFSSFAAPVLGAQNGGGRGEDMRSGLRFVQAYFCRRLTPH